MATRSLGTLTLDLIARIGGFESGLTKAERLTEKEFKKIQQHAERVGKAIGSALSVGAAGLAAGAGVLTAYVAHQTEVISGFQDLAEKIGDTAENIASLQRAVDVSETSFDSIAAASIKLTAALSKTDDEGKGVGAALKYIGLELEAFKRLSPVEQLDAVAKGMAGVKEGADRTAVAVALFGKSGAELLPFLGDLADGSERQITLTQQQIQNADELAKSFARQKSELAILGQQFAAGLIPVLKDTLEVVKGLVTKAEDLDKATDTLTSGNAIQEWAQKSAVALGGLADAFMVAATAGKALYTIQTSMQAITSKLLSPLSLFREQNRKDLASAVEQAEQAIQDLKTLDPTRIQDALRRKFSQIDAVSANSTVDMLLANATGLDAFRVAEDQVQFPFRLGSGAPKKEPFSLAGGGTKESKGAAAKAPKEDLDAFNISMQHYLQNLEDMDTMQVQSIESLRRQAEQMVESLRTPNEVWEQQIQVIDELYNRQYIDAETRTRALSKANEDLYSSLDALEPKLQETNNALSVFADQAARNMQDAFADFLFDPFSQGLDGMVEGFAVALRRMAANALAEQAISGLLSLGASFFGGMGVFSGSGLNLPISGRSTGGGVEAGGMYEVNEIRPEMLTVGNRDYLMMGSRDGKVTATPSLASAGGLHVNQTFNVSGPMTDSMRRSLKQTGLDAARALQGAVRSNG